MYSIYASNNFFENCFGKNRDFLTREAAPHLTVRGMSK